MNNNGDDEKGETWWRLDNGGSNGEWMMVVPNWVMNLWWVVKKKMEWNPLWKLFFGVLVMIVYDDGDNNVEH